MLKVLSEVEEREGGGSCQLWIEISQWYVSLFLCPIRWHALR